jgi:phosphoglycerate dehydrogenase-like enzyme
MPAPEPRVAVAPASAPWIEQAVLDGGGTVVDPADATAVVWTHPDDAAGLASLLEGHPHLDWVQLPWAGIEPYRSVLDHHRRWTNAKGVYGEPVAEMALAMLLAGLRHLVVYAGEATWTEQRGRNLVGARVTIVGGGGITAELVRLLEPFRCDITVVRRRPEAMVGVGQVLPIERLHDSLATADAVVLALPLLPETEGLIGGAELEAMANDAWLVNVARGGHVQTDALVAALREGRIGGAALDVTDPEPLPDDHPLWTFPNVLITPHTGNTKAMARPLLGRRIRENVARYGAGEPLEGMVDPTLGY